MSASLAVDDVVSAPLVKVVAPSELIQRHWTLLMPICCNDRQPIRFLITWVCEVRNFARLQVFQSQKSLRPTEGRSRVGELAPFRSLTRVRQSLKLLNGRERIMSMFSIRPSIIRHVTRASLRSFATVHKHEGASSPTRPRGWTPTPYVTETIVCVFFCSNVTLVLKLTCQGGAWHTCMVSLRLRWKKMLISLCRRHFLKTLEGE